MIIPRVIPCLLLKDGKIVKTVNFKKPSYIGNPVNAVQIFNEKEVDEIIILDIFASRERKKPNLKVIAEIADECFMPFAYGGGIKSLEEAKEIFRLGVEKVVLNSSVVENPSLIAKIAEYAGSQSVVISIDVKWSWKSKYEIFIFGGGKKVPISFVDWLKIVQEAGAGEIFLTSIDKDGTMEGYDLELISSVTNFIHIPLIVCGGAGKIEHFREAVKTGASAVAAGSMFVYQGKNRAVLINFPSRESLENLFSK